MAPAGRGSDAGGAQLACTVVAILLQFFYMSAVGWALLEGLHLYRRRSEARHVDRGPMRFYHVLGWGLPAFITGEDVPPGPLSPAPCCIPHPQAPASASIHPSSAWPRPLVGFGPAH